VLRTALVRRQAFFPDRRLLQYDCGKLQEMASLLRRLKSGGHRALIFTQMSKMLDVLEVGLVNTGPAAATLDARTGLAVGAVAGRLHEEGGASAAEAPRRRRQVLPAC
jgi:SNF2 family DNA or RNA helicase